VLDNTSAKTETTSEHVTEFSPWRYLDSIVMGTGGDLTSDALFHRKPDDGGYNPFLVNSMLSRYPDTLPFAYAMNRAIVNGLSWKNHYLYLYHAIPKKKRWSGRMSKAKRTDDKIVEAISEYTKENSVRAREYMRFLSEEQQKLICDAKGGVKRNDAKTG